MKEAIKKDPIKTSDGSKIKIKPSKPAKLRIKVEQVLPSDIIDVWHLYKQSLDKAPPKYPDMSEEPETFIRSQIFNEISKQNFLGLIAKVGRRPVGQLNGFVAHRPFGAPRVFFQFWMCWVDPEYRNSDVGTQLYKEMFRTLKGHGIFNVESIIDPEMVPSMEKVSGVQVQVVSHRIIAKVKVD